MSVRKRFFLKKYKKIIKQICIIFFLVINNACCKFQRKRNIRQFIVYVVENIQGKIQRFAFFILFKKKKKEKNIDMKIYG